MSKVVERVSVPTYDRSQVKAGIVHVGIGGFHRAHQAYYTDQLLHAEEHKDWGICGVALLDLDKKIYNTLKGQDGLYTLVVKELDGTLTESVIGSIVECLYAPENPSAVIEKMADESIRIITLTITEGGYNYNEASKQFDFSNTSIQHDLENPERPKTIFGYLTQALKLRNERNLRGLAIQSCDNIQGNGGMIRQMLLTYVERAAPELVDWIKSNVSFPNSMVDRITPATTQLDIDKLKDISGIEDAWPVVCEPFKQWVIEDDFVAGRPPWEGVGAQFVEDVAPYEKMKLRLLNAGHSVLGILGALMGFETIDEAVNHPQIRTFLMHYMDVEVTPVILNVDGINLKEYKNSLIARFSNVYIKDQIERICSESSSKVPIFILPTVNTQLEENGPIEGAAFVIAAWAIYNLGKDENENTLNIKDVMSEKLHSKAIEAKDRPELFLEMEAVFGDIKESSVFIKAYINAYNNIMKYGVEKSIISLF
ncbi:UNVERIFIED_CONTAM: hypothetical protein GTU68_011808 [Idotea baltica]|nr:hypothetical protein [Idotea baltica]